VDDPRRGDDPQQGSVEDALRVLWVRVAPDQREHARQLLEQLERVRVDGDLDAWGQVHDGAHRLAGTLGSFAQHDAGREALAIERLTSPSGSVAGVSTEGPDDVLLARVTAHAVELLRHLQADGPPAP
jgi:hypothetical protein